MFLGEYEEYREHKDDMGDKYPRLIINLSKIEANARVAVEEGACHKIWITGVTKACLGAPEIGRAMLTGGVTALADSRLENLERLRFAGLLTRLVLLRLPMPSETEAVVRLADISLNSSADTILALGRAALKTGRSHGIIIMVDTGDEREGVSPAAVHDLAAAAEAAAGIDFLGVGTNVACLTGCPPSPANLGLLAEAAGIAAETIGRPLEIISGGNSSAWGLLRKSGLPKEINELRLGEAILLGRETVDGTSIPEMFQDAFLLEAEIIESLPERNGHHIAALGLQDAAVDDLVPLDAAWRIVKASSDHLVLRRDGAPIPVGSTVGFRSGYSSLLRAMTSPFVVKEYI